MSTRESAFDRLHRELGDDAVQLSDPATAGAREPVAVVRPAAAGEAAIALRVCSAEGWSVRIRGGGTRSANHVVDADVVVRTDRLHGIVEYEPADLTACALAGTWLAALDAAFATNAQHWPVDAPAIRGATLGGAIATAAAGPSRYALGTPRDHVLGLQLVTGNGRVIEVGGRVVKNVAGYDLVRLATGSRGTLGLITKAHVRLRARHAAEVTAAYFASQPAPLLELARSADSAWPTALELLSPSVAHAVTDEVRWTLLVRCTGNREFIDHARSQLVQVSAERCVLLDDNRAADAWRRLNRVESDAALLVRIVAPPARLDVALDAALAIRRPDAGRWRIAAHAGNGIVRLWRVDAVDADRAERLASSIRELRGTLAGERVEFHVAASHDTMPADIEHSVVDERVASLERGIRTVFDPAAILNPALQAAR